MTNIRKPRPVRKPHTPLRDITPTAGRAAVTPRRPARPITFDSAL